MIDVYYSNREGEASIKPLKDFEQAKRHLKRFYKNTGAKYSLDNMRDLMSYLDSPQDHYPAVHVAGTSGKTSTAYYVSALLTAAGRKTGLTVSPHVDEINERVQINSQPIGEAEFCGALTEFLTVIEGANLKLSWFEVMAGFAFWYFAHAGVDYAVVEVGLGGLKDGTNVITRTDKVAVITDIGLDHTNVLGDTLPEIAAQKIGIVQPGNTAFTYKQSDEIMQVYENYCQAQGADLITVEAEESHDYRHRNWQLAQAVYDFVSRRDGLPALDKKSLDNTKQTLVPGRLDVREVKGKTLVMDGAHNVQKMTAFWEGFRGIYPEVKPAVLLSLRDGKDYRAAAELIAHEASRVIVTEFSADQDTPAESMDLAKLGHALKTAGAETETIPRQDAALKALLDGPEEVLVITGSFYLLGQLRKSKLLV